MVTIIRSAMNTSTASDPDVPGDGHAQGDPMESIEAVRRAGLTDLLIARLTGRQQQVWAVLAKGTGIREAGRQLSISHVAILKHRRKIARAATRLLAGRRDEAGEPGMADATVAVAPAVQGRADLRA